MKEIVVEAAVENLDAVMDFVSNELQCCDVKLAMQISLAVYEIFVNIAHYAYGHNVGNAVIRLSVEREIVIEFEDTGIPFNPLTVEEPDIGTDAMERPIGGLGIFMVKKIMDTVDYNRTEGKNMLLLKKVLK